MFDWNSLLVQIHNWVVSQSTPIKAASYLLGGFSLIFGGKVLGRFLNLTEKGGFYSSVLFAVPVAACFAAFTFAEDEATQHTFSRLYTSAFHFSFDSASLALFTGIVSLIFLIANPNTFRSGDERRAYGPGELFVVFVSMAFYAFSTTYIFVYYVLVVLHWFSMSIPPWWAFAICGFIFGLACMLVLTGREDGDSASASSGRNTLVLFGCLVAALLGIPIYLSSFLITGSLILRFGWVMIIFLVTSTILYGLIYALRYLADHLDRAMLLRIFAIPGAIALILQFAVNNVNSLPH